MILIACTVLAALFFTFPTGDMYLLNPHQAAPPQQKYDPDLNSWLKRDAWPEACQSGRSQKTLETALSGLSINWNLPDLLTLSQKSPKEQSQSQVEFSSPDAYFSEKRL